jgi:methionyl aminopeptidase
VIELKSHDQLMLMRQGGAILANTLSVVGAAAKAGTTTLELDILAEQLIRDSGAVPAFKGYQGFPSTLCTSLNEQVIHGKPNKRPLVVGDLLTIDVGLIWQGLVLDHATTLVIAGESQVNRSEQSFLMAGKQSLEAAIDAARVGNRVGDISAAMQGIVEHRGYSVVREYAGHGVGSELHMEPFIPCYGNPGRGMLLAEGMTLAIEVMFNMGGSGVKTLKDGWTVVTKDGTLSAQFEHTVAVTDAGPEILTKVI